MTKLSLNILELKEKTFLTKYRPGEPDLSLEGLFPAHRELFGRGYCDFSLYTMYTSLLQMSHISHDIFLYQLTLYDPWFPF